MNKPLYNQSRYSFLRMILPAMALLAIGAHKAGYPAVCYGALGAALVLCVPIVLSCHRLRRCRTVEGVYGQRVINVFSGRGQKRLRYKLIDAAYLMDVKDKYRKAADILEYLEDRCKTDADYATVQLLLGDAYRGLGNHPEARCYYNDALSHDETFAMAWDRLGLSHAKAGRTRQAIECYTNAIKYDDKYALAYHNLGTAFYKLGDYEKCVEYCLQSLRLMPRFYSPAEMLSAAYYRLGNKEKSDEYFRMVGLLGGNQKMLLDARADFDKEQQEAQSARTAETAETTNA